MLCSLSNLEIRAGNTRLLSGINLSIHSTGFYAIMGPVGVGKSTLLAVLDGHGNSNGLSISYDAARYADETLNLGNHPIVIEQANRSEQAQRAINGGTIKQQIKDALAQNPAMLCLDEPTAGVAHNEALFMLDWLKQESEKRAIVMVTHNSEQARSFADWVVLLGGGEIVEQGPADTFFKAPRSPITKHFIKTGSLSLPRLDAHPRQLAPEHRGLPEGINTQTVGTADGPLKWIIRRSFAIAHLEGANGPGFDDFIEVLRGRRVNAVVVPNNIEPKISKALTSAEIELIEYSTPNAGAPWEIRASLNLASEIEGVISRGSRVAVLQTESVRAGVLAAVQLIHVGITAKDAIDLLNVKEVGIGIHLQDEQFLWDLELVLDLCSDTDQPSMNGNVAPLPEPSNYKKTVIKPTVSKDNSQ